MEEEATRGLEEATLLQGQANVAPARARGGRVLGGRYRIQAMLGTGGMGSVFLAFDEELGERVAVKMLKPELVADEVMLERFRSEVRLARRVTHRNVARTYDIGEDGSERFLTMEFIDGESLFDRLRRLGPLPFDFLVSVADGIAAGLAAAHDAGVVHRDLKPQNVMLARDGRVVLTDFGIAVARGESDIDTAGTPAYMAPEQVVGNDVDERADIFALGVVMYRMATGRLPFGDDARSRSPSPDPCEVRATLPGAFGAMVRRCLAPEPTGRYASAAEVKRALALLPTVTEDAPLTLANSLSIVRQLEVTGQRLVVVTPVAAPPALETIAKWLAGALGEALAENPLVRVTTAADARAEVAIECVVEGTEERLKAVVGLRANRDGRVFWEGEVDVETDVAKLPVAISAIVESALAVDVPVGPDLPPLPRACVVPYVRARTALASSFGGDVAEALGLLASVATAAPDHPLILSTIAYAKSRTSFWRGELFDDARATSERAVALAPRLAESHLALANVAWQACDPEAMAGALRSALALAPGHPQARHMLAQLLLEAGAPGDATRLLENVLTRAPHLHRARIDLAHAFALRGLYDRAAQTLDAVPENHTEHASTVVWRCRHALWRRDADMTRRILAVSSADASLPLVRGFVELYTFVLEGKPTRLFPPNPILSASEGAVARRRAISAQFGAEADAYNGLWDDVFVQLERSVHEGLQDVFWFDRCPVLDEIRGSRRFEALRTIVRERGLRALAALDDVDAS